jgi:hypothetical protein
MMRKWLLTIAILLLSLPSGRAGLIPNGDFETGDFTDWLPQSSSGPLGTATAAVEFLDGSYRAVLKLDIPSGLGATSSELLPTSNPSSWGSGHWVQFDASYSYSIDAIGATAFFGVTAGPDSLILVNATQADATPISGFSPLTTYTLPWDGKSYIDVFPTIFTQNPPSPGGLTLTVILDNFQIIPEPSTWVLATTALVGAPFFVARRRRR